MKAASPLYVSYYTTGTGYEAEAAALMRTLEEHKLPYYVAGVPPGSGEERWNWARATQYKAELIRDVQRENPGRPIVWLDADARVVRRPRLFDWIRCHFAAHWFRNRELVSSTLYFAPGERTRNLVEKWIERNKRKPDRRYADQRNLRDLVFKSKDLSVVNLPPEYAWIDAGDGNDLSERTYGLRRPVIVQEQASRRLKNAKPSTVNC
jgi:hypothetical protein